MTYLTEEEEAFLGEHFRYFSKAFTDQEPIEIINSDQLLTREGLQEVLGQIHTHMESQFFLTTVSIFSKRYSYFIVTGILAMISGFDKCPDPRPENTRLVRIDDDKNWFPKLDFVTKAVTTPDPGNRQAWLRASLTQVFKCHIRPLFLHINQSTRLSMNVLWENFVVYLFWFYERYAEGHFDNERLAQIYDDFQYIVHELDGESFGEEENPLRYYYYQSKLPSGARERKYCCLNYRLNESSEYCKICPHRC